MILSAEVAAAQAAGRPLVALESTIIAHGLPWPANADLANALEQTVRDAGAVPATIACRDGEIRIGLSAEELRDLATAGRAAEKLSARDLGPFLAAGGGWGATTVAGTMRLAARAGIRVFATGGLGGVHPGGETTLDISADLIELGRTPVAVVCAGAKSILDLPRTLEVLETQGVPVIGCGTGRFPAFYTPDSGLAADRRIDEPAAIADACRRHWQLDGAGLVIAQPIDAASALDPAELAGWIATAEAEAAAAGVTGKAITPFLLGRLAALSNGRSVEANKALVLANARLAARIAAAL